MPCSWSPVRFGTLDKVVMPLGLASSYGIGEAGVRRAFDRGVNLFYWGSLRRAPFGRAVTDLARTHRDEMIVVIQSYTRLGMLLRPSLQVALKRLRLDHADVLLLGMWNRPVPERILGEAQRCVEQGLAKQIMVSCHDRPTFSKHAADPRIGAVMVRYNAAHPGAETEVFPLLPERPLGVVAYTATSWGQLLNPSRMPEGLRVPQGADCYRFQLSHPRVDVALCGPKDDAQLDEAMAALDRGPMTPAELAWMKLVGAAVK